MANNLMQNMYIFVCLSRDIQTYTHVFTHTYVYVYISLQTIKFIYRIESQCEKPAIAAASSSVENIIVNCCENFKYNLKK